MADVAKGRARMTLKSAVIRKVWARDRGKCRMCGRALVRFRCHTDPMEDAELGHIDHIIPRSLGGTNRPSNLRLVCEHFNLTRHAGTDSDGTCEYGRGQSQ